MLSTCIKPAVMIHTTSNVYLVPDRLAGEPGRGRVEVVQARVHARVLDALPVPVPHLTTLVIIISQLLV